MRLVRLLDQRGYGREDILELFRVLDWMLQLPDVLEQEFKRELIAFEEQANMLLSLLAVKFGPLGETDRRRVLDADAETLLDWSTRLLSASTLDEVFAVGPRPDAAH